MKSKKLNVLLGKTDHLASSYVNMVKDYSKFFSKNQGDFLGEKRTYIPREGTVDEPSKRKHTVMVTTVNEKLDWFKENAAKYIDSLMSVEATNASGNAKATLIVDGANWGEFTSLELLRLKSIIESAELKQMIEHIPTRPDNIVWENVTDSDYIGRDVYQTPMTKGVEKTTIKESYILEDPNASKLKDGVQYIPQVAQKVTVMELGDFTHQVFSGHWSHAQRAKALKKRAELLTAIVGALKECNEAEAVESKITSEMVFGYLFE